MNLRSVIIFAVLLSAFVARAQRDSVVLKVVTVYGLPEEKYLSGSRMVLLDSVLQAQQESRHLGELLAFQLPLYFRNYGNGMLSGISMRGTSPSHTAVLWNGININSFSLGQADFSILPAVAFDRVQVHVGGGSARFGSGAFGGSILLSSAHRSSAPVVSVSQEAGSFGRYFTSLKTSLEAGRFYITSSFYRLQSENDFPIPGSDQRQSHAAFRQTGFVQNLQYEWSSSRKIKLDYWYHAADREIQPTVGNSGSADEQQDYNHRLIIAYEQNGRFGLLKFSGGMVDDKIVFNGMQSEILRWIASASHQYSFKKQWNFSMAMEWNHIIGRIPEYDGEPVEDRVDVSASVQKSFKKISGSVSIRKPFITAIQTPALPYAGIDVIIFEKERALLKFRVNGSKNFRAPTMNDRYWQDAGRKDLNPETSYAAESGLEFLRGDKLKLHASGFYQDINEWIQWVPGQNGVFRPRNVKEVNVKGFETGIGAKFNAARLIFHGNAAYQFTRSVTRKTLDPVQDVVGKQLIYTPVHTGSASFGSTFETWTSGIYAQYSGKRFTEAANSSVYALDPFVLFDFSVGKAWTFDRHVLDASATIKNIFDTSYMMFSGRAMPGRNYSLKILYNLNPGKNEHSKK